MTVEAKHLRRQLEIERALLACTARAHPAREVIEHRIVALRDLIYFVENGQAWPVGG